MNPTDPMTIFERFITGNPVIVGLLVMIAVVLWRRIESQDKAHADALDRANVRYEAMAEKTTTAINGMTGAVRDLTHALDRRDR